MDASCVYLQDGIHDAALPPLTSVEEAIQQLTLMITNPNCTDTDSCNCGGGSSIELQVNDTPNVDQTLLNLTDGTNIAITDEGGGQVKITNTYVPINLPVPKVLLKGTGQISKFDYETNVEVIKSFDIKRTPVVIANDLSQELLDKYPVFVEMVFYKQNRKGKSIVVPSSYSYGSGTAINPLEVALGNPALKTRGGLHYRKIPGTIPAQHELITATRPNHYRVYTPNQKVAVSDYLNGWFTKLTARYTQVGGATGTFSATAAFPNVGNSSILATNIKGYSPFFKPLYIAFRYIAWDATLNGGAGDFVSGPLSQTVAVSTEIFPLILESQGGYLSPSEHSLNVKYDDDTLNCWFVHRK
jgi:hypothetical protein